MKQLWETVYFLTLVSCVVSDTLVFRTPGLKTMEPFGAWNHETRKLFCTSDSFNDALIWNTNLDWVKSSLARDTSEKSPFSDASKYSNSKINCDFNESNKCIHDWELSSWNRWNFTSTLKKPMGPVFDRRWEDFTEYGTLFSQDDYRFVHNVENKGTLIFSVRGSTDAHLLLCNSGNYQEASCFVILIGGWKNTKSAIRKCQTGVPKPPLLSNTCPDLTKYHHRPLSSEEWRTFILSWNFMKNSDISLKDIIITSDSFQNYTFKVEIKNYKPEPKIANATYSLFYRSMYPVLFRFHIYDYFQTTKVGDSLSSPALEIENFFCIEMIMGLCDECKMMLRIIDVHNNLILRSKKIELKSSSFHKLPMWQNEKWNVTLPFTKTKVKLNIITLLKRNSSNPLWAVASIRECPSNDYFKTTVMKASQDEKENYYWPNITCQRLSYDGSTIVSSVSEVSSTVNLNNELCPEGKIGEHCAMDCQSLMDGNYNCAEIVVCNKQSCMCPQGFVGKTCSRPCDLMRYGFGCTQTCGHCFQYSECNYLTGECPEGCDKTKKYYLKPLCETGIDVPPPPKIEFLNETYVKVSLPIPGEYREIKAQFLFVIREDGNETSERSIGRNIIIFDYLQTLEEYKDNLRPGIFYQVKGIVLVTEDASVVNGKWTNFTTPCTAITDFKIYDIGKTSFKLMMLNDSYYSCPPSLYDVIVETETEIIFFGKVSYIYDFLNLMPFTVYNVSITRNKTTYFSESIRTSISAPSEVRNLEVTLITDTEVSLQWRRPEKENGYLEGYEISVQLLELYGCYFNKTVSQIEKVRNYVSHNETIHIQNLHPYARYNFKITARVGDYSNTIIGIPIGINFTTYYTEKPTAVFSDLRLIRDKLVWDPPKNCLTISGPIQLAKLIFTGSSKAVINYKDSRETTNYYFKLGSQNQTIYGAEYYFVNLYVARVHNGKVNINVHNYQRIKFLAPAKAPPAVRNFDIYEINSREKTSSLRWQPPNPPTNGEIIIYTVEFCSSSKCHLPGNKILPNETCELWNGYICATVQQPNETFTYLRVYAHNKNVHEPGKASQIINDQNEKVPDAPSHISAVYFSKGIVNLSWSHPWKSGGPLEKFLIRIKLMSTKLRNIKSSLKQKLLQEHKISKYNLTYETRLFLLSSSDYEIFVQAITSGKSFGNLKHISIRTPISIAFSEEIQTKTYDVNSTISIRIPEIANDTMDSVTYVIVKGPNPCEEYLRPDESLRKIADIKYFEISWCAAYFPSERYANREFSIGDNKTYGEAKNCVLYPEQTYVVFIVVRNNNENAYLVTQTKSIFLGKLPRVLYEVWLILAIVLIIVLVVLYFLYFRKIKRPQSKLNVKYEVALVQNMSNHLKKLSAENVQKLSTENVQKLSTENVQKLSTENVQKLSTENVQKLSTENVQKLSTENVQKLSTENVQKLSTENVQKLSTENVQKLSTENVQKLSTENVRKISLNESSLKTKNMDEDTFPEPSKSRIENSRLIKVKDFEDYVKQAVISGELDEQFDAISKGLIKSTDYGKLTENRMKNRYAKLITYDESRVVLQKLPDDPHSDYINASYIKNTTKDRYYIATQGPKPNTVIDFWRMVWQEKVSVICMVANTIENGKVKCEQYWPEVSKRKIYGDVIVSNVEERILNYYTVRSMKVTFSKETRKIVHLQYTEWPDHGIPIHLYSVVSFMQEILATSFGEGPMVVHCSAGVGRTGTIILLHICLHQAATKGAINIQEEFKEIRNQRYLIENKQQYLFVHLILVEYLFPTSTNFPCDENLSTRIEELKMNINEQEQRLKEISWRNEALHPLMPKKPLSEKNQAKNRFPKLAAEAGNKVYLKRYPVSDEDSDYISAVYVDGVKQKNQYLATQLPLPSTLSDFWRMIAELKVEIIIMLQSPDTEDSTCCELIPAEKEFKPVKYLSISVKSEDVTNSYKLKTVQLVDHSEKVAREQSIILISCSKWRSGKSEKLPNPEMLVSLWQTVEKVQKGENPVVTICYDGVTGCGIYLALSFLLERMTTEGVCDIISAIRAVRKSRPDFVQSIKHLEFLYDAALRVGHFNESRF